MEMRPLHELSIIHSKNRVVGDFRDYSGTTYKGPYYFALKGKIEQVGILKSNSEISVTFKYTTPEELQKDISDLEEMALKTEAKEKNRQENNYSMKFDTEYKVELTH